MARHDGCGTIHRVAQARSCRHSAIARGKISARIWAVGGAVSQKFVRSGGAIVPQRLNELNKLIEIGYMVKWVTWLHGGVCLLLIAGVERGDAQERAGKDPVIVDEKTEAIIKGALKYLASKQSPNGAWASSAEEQQHPIAITGYTLMAF